MKATNTLNTLAQAYAYISSIPCTMIITTFIFNYDDRSNWFFFNFANYINLSATYILILAYKAPRPFYVDESVSGLDCQYGYAKPSDCLLNATQIFLTLWFIYLYRNSKKIVVKIIGILLILLMIGLLFASRLYLGANFLD